jgi:hypothetical protein
MSVKITGLNELQRKLKDMGNRAKQLSGSHNLSDVLTPEFVRRSSRFNSLQELLESSGFNINSQADLEAVPKEQWDAFIRANTNYRSWEAMLQAGGQILVKKKLGL